MIGCFVFTAVYLLDIVENVEILIFQTPLYHKFLNKTHTHTLTITPELKCLQPFL